MIPKVYIEKLLAAADIVGIIGAEVKLTRTGSNYHGICPFHGTDHPEDGGVRPKSFKVSRENNTYHCFVCNAHGSVINFFIQHRGVGFPVAVEMLAALVGAEPPPCAADQAVMKAKREAVAESLQIALDYYQRSLRTSPEAIAMLKKAGISGKTAARFKIGFAPDGWQNLEGVFKDRYEERCTAAGLAVVSKHGGKVYDRLRNRVIFPTMNARDTVLGLAGLALAFQVPEYLRTTSPNKSSKKGVKEKPGTLDLHEAKESMFGLSQANSSMHAKRFVVLVQDCMDVLRLHEGGIQNVVSSAEAGKLKPENIARLFRRTPCIVCCFPSTKRGANMAWNTMKIVLPMLTDAVQVRFAILPDEQSPGDLLQMEDGRELFQLMLNSALPLSEFFLQGLASKYRLDDLEGKAKLLSDADALLATMSAPKTKALLDEAVRELVADQLELLDSVDEHDQWLKSVIAAAGTEVLIVSPWITNAGIRRFDLCGIIAAAVARGVRIRVFTDIEFSRERRRLYASGERSDDGAEAALLAAGAQLHFVNRIHGKIVVVDATALCIGSFNWLSAAKAGPYQRHEVSVVHRKGNIALRKTKLLATMQSRASDS
ncbi:CHC2 zinc finger domain-containing protein [Janthinobacterium sp. UMAB-60]|uniref:CHC2 zinc finger domain-containing protein n=1 Tax=Janthinobacterium sp. UMAB-60 TaxID=1365365 RepID=UPI001C58A3BD|nr:CHC2 zinc finger domain-containing protein [Janthinobacterium sp. UMAB-60]